MIKGDINAQDFEEIFDVHRGLAAFFSNHRQGILEAKESVVAVWKGVKVYYMFDPQQRGPSGKKVIVVEDKNNKTFSKHVTTILFSYT